MVSNLISAANFNIFFDPLFRFQNGSWQIFSTATKSIKDILIAPYMTVVSPLLTQWRYHSIALSHYVHQNAYKIDNFIFVRKLSCTSFRNYSSCTKYNIMTLDNTALILKEPLVAIVTSQLFTSKNSRTCAMVEHNTLNSVACCKGPGGHLSMKFPT